MTTEDQPTQNEPVQDVATEAAEATTAPAAALTGRIDAVFAAARENKRGVLCPFVCGGYPTVEQTGPVIEAAAGAGSGAGSGAGGEIIEIGLPFSDPIADGPVIANAMDEASRPARRSTACSSRSRQSAARPRPGSSRW